MSDQTATNDMKVTYGDFNLDFATLPHASLMAMVRRGVSHFFGSEQASKVTALFDPDRKLAEGETRLEDTPENREAAKAKFQAAALQALQEGKVGVSVRGPTIDPIQAIVQRLARAEIVTILKNNGTKPPKKVDDLVELKNGDKVTMAQLIGRRLDPTGPAGVDSKGAFGPAGTAHLDRLTKEAQKIQAEAAKKAKKQAEAAATAGDEL